MNLRIVLKLLGGLLIILSFFLTIPGLVGTIGAEPAGGDFLTTAGCGVFLGCILLLSTKSSAVDLNHRTGMAVVAVTWISAAIIGAAPYFLSGTTPSLVDALFESVSGFSGTGASILSGLEELPRSILLWRSMTQWLGGMGIIVFFLAILPILGMGGVQLFRAEITGPSKDKITPRVHETAKKLWGLYLGLTLLLTFLLHFAGMDLFDSVNHAMTTLSTGGFSTRGEGIAAFDSALIDYILIFFMLVSSINFSLHFQLLATKDWGNFFSTELKWYLWLLVIATAGIMISAWLIFPNSELAFRQSLFTVVCTASSTGFTYVDYNIWPVGSHVIIIMLMIMGGMSGSTAGGIKCIRIVAALKQLSKELKRVIHPHGVYAIKVNNHSIPDNVINAIWGFVFLYVSVFAFLTLVLTFEGLDLVSSATAAFSALSNIGPALGELGPMDNYAELSILSKTVLMGGMMLGRLEFYTLMVIFTVEYWRK